MITEIGIVAGEVLELLDQKDGVLVFGEIHLNLKQSRDLVLMSLGWLLYENYLHIMEEPLGATFQNDYRNIVYVGKINNCDLVVGNNVVTLVNKRISNITEHLGIVAGKVLDLLEGYGELLDLQIIEQILDEHRDLILMCLGWLVREGYVRGIDNTHDISIFRLPKERESSRLSTFCQV